MIIISTGWKHSLFRILYVVALIVGMVLWFGTIQPFFETRRFRKAAIAHLLAATDDSARAAVVAPGGQYVAFPDHQWLAVRYGESTTGAWALSIACDSAGHWFEGHDRIKDVSHFTAATPFELSSLTTTPDVTAAEAMLKQHGFLEIGKP
jgi:hypothetical protein